MLYVYLCLCLLIYMGSVCAFIDVVFCGVLTSERVALL